MLMKLFNTISLLTLIFLCLSCSQKPAQIVNNSKNTYNKNSEYSKGKYRNLKQNGNSKNPSATETEVKSGDTLFSISKKYQVPLRDLIEHNNLGAPYNLKSGTKLKIPSPSYHEVKAGETLYAVSRTYNMNIDKIVEMNNLQQPYQLKVGQKIKVSNQEIPENKPAAIAKELKKEQAAAPKFQIASPKTEEKTAPNLVEKTLEKINNFSGHFAWPINGEIISKFGPKKGGLYNDGINIKAKEGSAVKASEGGVVAYVGNELKGYGNLVIIKHSGGWITAYAHLSKTTVKRGQQVKKLDKIAEVGSSGKVSSPQLYFGLRKGRDAVNPENYLKK